MRFPLALCSALVPLLLGSLPLYAQTILGDLVDEDAAAPLAGAYVVLLDEHGAEVDAYLSDAAGAFFLRALAPGQYRLRVERIGHQALLTPVLELEAGEPLAYRLAVPSQPVDLTWLGPAEDPECVADPEATFATARLWDEISTALAIAVWTGQWAPLRVEVNRYARDLELENLQVVRQETNSWVQTGGQTFTSLPASELTSIGYVRQEPDGSYMYHGPDPEALLSDEFRDTHCFAIHSGEDPEGENWVGLAFQPVPERELPDLAGVLWVDRGTAELRRLEFRYVALPFTVRDAEPGGRIDFLRLPGGEWIIERWRIRLPVMTAGDDPRTLAIHEEAAEVTAVHALDGMLLARLRQGALFGTVVDSVGDAPIAGAMVRLAGTEYTDTADAQGWFRIDGVPEGTYVVEVSHPDIGSLGIGPELGTVHIPSGSDVHVRLHAPGPAAVLAEVCPEAVLAEPAAAVAGVVQDSLSGVPLPGAEVVARLGEGEEVRALADTHGMYRFCQLPAGVPLSLRVEVVGRTGIEVGLQAPGPGRLVRRDLAIALAPTASIVTQVLEQGRSGPTRLLGRVLDVHTLAPIDAVDVRLEDAGLRRATDNDGRFVFPRVEPGSYELVLDHLAYGTQTEDVLVQGGELIEVEVRLAVRPIELEPLTVVVQRRPLPPKMAGFYERMDRGWGDFITRKEIENRQAGRVSHMIGELPGMRLIYVRAGEYMPVVSRYYHRIGGTCPPAVYLDGIPLMAGAGDIDSFVLPHEVEAVEVYKSAATVPARFGGSTARCGVIVIWTRSSW